MSTSRRASVRAHLSLASISALVVAAITISVQAHAQNLTAGTEKELPGQVRGQSDFWPKPYKIPVCFEQKENKDNKDYRKWVKSAGEENWDALSDIEFSWFDCDDKPDLAAKAIRIVFLPTDKSLLGSWPGIGKKFAGQKNALQLNYGKAGETPEATARGTAVHELGHALGFDHEQVRGDKRSKACQKTRLEKEQATDPNASYSITDYDPSSVMNYCYSPMWDTGDDKWLSRLDVQGLQKVYGTGGLDMDKSCTASDQCPFFHGAGQRGGVCCGGKCTMAERDWAGVYYCPNECVGKEGGSPGTCPRKDDGEACKVAADCILFEGSDQPGSGCCNGVCGPVKKDWAGAYSCEEQCVGRAGASPGTCPLAEDGDECKVHADCEGSNGLGKEGSACCGGTCTPMKKDFAGVWYCPAECRGSPTAGAGTCGAKKPDGASCSSNDQCDGFNGLGKKGSACCNGKCAPLKKDWAGVYYCKDDCVGAAGASKGTCPLKGKGDKCKVEADCKGSYSCCDGKCRKKLKDWAGVKYCPNECVGKFGGKKGTCD